MVALLKTRYRDEPQFDEVLAEHPGFPRLIALKPPLIRTFTSYAAPIFSVRATAPSTPCRNPSYCATAPRC